MLNSTVTVANNLSTTTVVALERYNGLGYHTYRLSPAGYILFGCYLTLVFVVGSLANGTGLLMFIKNKHLRSPTNIFIMNLAIADFSLCFFGVQGSLHSSFRYHWIWGELGCNIEGFTVYFIGMAQMYLLCAVAFDRYIVIAKPLLSSKITPTVAWISCGLCWTGGFFWAAVPFLGWNYYRLEGSMVTCSVAFESEDPVVVSYVVAIFIFCLIIPLGVMAYAYFHVFMTVRTVARSSSMTGRVARKNLKIEKKMLKTVLLMLGVYLVAWTPYTVVSFYAAFGDASKIPTLLAVVPPIAAKSGATADPFIYIATNKQFRMAFYSMIPCSGLKDKLVKKEEAKPESEESDMDDEKTKNATTTVDSKKKSDNSKKGKGNKVSPATVDDQGSDGNEVTQVEEFTTKGKAEETEMQTLKE